jgi:hypothetical protein
MIAAGPRNSSGSGGMSGIVALTAVPVTFLLTRRADLTQAASAPRPEVQPAAAAD